MCRRVTKRYRCGHRRAPDEYQFCWRADVDKETNEKKMCEVEQPRKYYEAEQLCGSQECLIEDMARFGWTCCKCNYTWNRLDNCLGAGGADCAHKLCANCDYSKF